MTRLALNHRPDSPILPISLATRGTLLVSTALWRDVLLAYVCGSHAPQLVKPCVAQMMHRHHSPSYAIDRCTDVSVVRDDEKSHARRGMWSTEFGVTIWSSPVVRGDKEQNARSSNSQYQWYCLKKTRQKVELTLSFQIM